MRGLEGNFQAQPRVFAHDALPLNQAVIAGQTYGFAGLITKTAGTGSGWVAGDLYTSVANAVIIKALSVDGQGFLNDWSIVNPGTACVVGTVLTFNAPTAGSAVFSVDEIGLPSTDGRGACLFIGGAGATGTVTVVMESGNIATFTGIGAGSFLPILVTDVLLNETTGPATDVTGVLALY